MFYEYFDVVKPLKYFAMPLNFECNTDGSVGPVSWYEEHFNEIP